MQHTYSPSVVKLGACTKLCGASVLIKAFLTLDYVMVQNSLPQVTGVVMSGLSLLNFPRFLMVFIIQTKKGE